MKTCPFKQYQKGEPIVFKNVELSQEEANSVHQMLLSDPQPIIKLHTSDGAASIQPIHSVCNESDCALWDEDNQCCAFKCLRAMFT
jgi:hypothetical protein